MSKAQAVVLSPVPGSQWQASVVWCTNQLNAHMRKSTWFKENSVVVIGNLDAFITKVHTRV